MKILGKILCLLLCLGAVSLSAQEVDRQKFLDRLGQYEDGRHRDLIPNQVIDRIQALNFSRIKDAGWGWDFEAYYAELDDIGLDIVCNRKLVSNVEVENIEDFFNSLKRAIIRTSPRIKCAPSLRSAISLSSLNSAFEELKNDNKFRNSSPGGLCFNRTYLISKRLNDLGIASKQLLVTGWAVGAFEYEGYYGVEGYDIHNANIVNVESKGKIAPYVVDPMFFDRPVPLEEYKQNISVEEIENDYQITPQTFHFGDYYPGKAIDVKGECSYNEARLITGSNQIEDLLNSVEDSAGTLYYNEESGIYPQIRQDKVSTRDEAVSLYKRRFSEMYRK